MSDFQIHNLPADAQDDLRADARSAMFFALRSAFKQRSDEYNIRAKDLAEALDKDKGYVSRVLNGSSGSIDFETLIVFLEALGYHLPLNPVSYEDLRHKKVNFDARPHGIKFEIDSGQSSITKATNITKNQIHTLNIGYDVLAGETSSGGRTANRFKFRSSGGAQ